MSSEGTYDHLCARGHRFSSDRDDTDVYCQYCHGDPVWSNFVDETNDPVVGFFTEEGWKSLEIGTETCRIFCNLGHFHLDEVKLYRVPTPEEHQALRQYPRWDDPDQA